MPMHNVTMTSEYADPVAHVHHLNEEDFVHIDIEKLTRSHSPTSIDEFSMVDDFASDIDLSERNKTEENSTSDSNLKSDASVTQPNEMEQIPNAANTNNLKYAFSYEPFLTDRFSSMLPFIELIDDILKDFDAQMNATWLCSMIRDMRPQAWRVCLKYMK